MFLKKNAHKSSAVQQYKGFIVEQKPRSIISEAYRVLRTNIQYSSFDKQIKTIVVTSSEQASGKSTVSGNIALSFAQNEKRVIVVDCDLRNPSLHKKFRVSNVMGLSEVLIGREKLECAIQSLNENLDILTSGTMPPNPSEMIASSAMNNLIEKLKEKYDIVIFDATSLQIVTDTQILAVKADGTILVVRAKKTNVDSVIEAKNLLMKVGANIIGTVLYAVENTKGKIAEPICRIEEKDNDFECEIK